ncbi:MAG: CHRD domain-containing protein [Chthoniobacterales bacterium]|nr:CHRD domain-containing protein [Chthoniobacterales bacterium]
MKTLRIASIALALLVSTICFAGAQTFTGTFSGLNEVPPNASAGTGTATVTFNLALHTLTIQATFSNLTGTVTAAHLHAPAFPGVNAGVATQTPTLSGFPSGVTFGTYNMTFDTLNVATWNAAYVTANGGTAAGAETAFANALMNGQAYFNIHTNTFPGGEIRANLVPEPSTYALLTVGLLCAGLSIWRRRGHVGAIS